MQPTPSQHLSQMRGALSAERLGSYSTVLGEPLQDVVGRYCWNMALAESLYAPLHCLEIAFRNSIHAATSAAPFTATGSPVGDFWFKDASILVSPKSRKMALDAEIAIKGKGKAATAGQVVAALNFGFWVSLLKKTYAENPANARALGLARARGVKANQYPLWPALTSQVFPHFRPPGGNPRAGRSMLFNRLDAIREFRNRVMHHEPIWRGRAGGLAGNYVPLSDVFDEIMEVLGWISPEMQLTLRNPTVCRFPTVYAAGTAPYVTLLAAFP